MNETKIRVCGTCLYPVGLMSERPEFICLLLYHRMEIEDTKQITTNTELLPKLVTSRNEMIEERNTLEK